MTKALYVCNEDGDCSRVNFVLESRGPGIYLQSSDVLEFCDAVQAADDDLQENIVVAEMMRYSRSED